ncbi:MAG: hypothetical protein IJU52_09105 [Clostridia bacterium]|nr:hypothetical protein [Clostridia bacterium]
MSIFLMNFRRNMKAAFTTVKSNFKEYVCFIIALTMVQMLFCVLTVAVLNDQKIEEKVYTERGYDYHCSIGGLDASDVNLLMEIKKRCDTEDKLHFEYKHAGSEYRITFLDNYASCYQVFSEAVKSMNARYMHVALVTTPLYEHDRDAGSAWTLLLPLLGGTGVLAYFLVMALFRIRLNHFKFTYGVYMTYGADRKKLLSAAFYEMMLLVFLTFPAAIVLSYLCAALLYLPRGSAFGFYFASLPVTLVMSLVSSLLALLAPITLLARTPPVKVLKAEDNSNLVSSARKSADLLRKSAVRAELLGMWRFRKYLAVFLLSTVSFAVLFFAGASIAQSYTVNNDIAAPSFTVRATSEERYRSFVGFFKSNAAANGVGATVEKSAANPFSKGGARENDQPPALAVRASDAVPGFFDELAGSDGEYGLTDKLEIRAYDADARACIDEVYGYAWSGDPDLPLTDPDAVIVSSTFANSRALRLKPGDSVYLSVNYYPYPGAGGEGDMMSTASKSENGVYVFRAYKVAAVIDNYADLDGMLVYLPVTAKEGEISAYEAVMGSAPLFTEARIYVEGEDQEKLAAMMVEDYLSDYGGIEYVRNYATVNEEAATAKNRPGLIMTLSLIILAVSPLAGVFSQMLFYRKRAGEFDVLRAVGGTKKVLRRIFLIDALVAAAASCACYALLAYGASYLITAFLNSGFSALFSGGTGAKIYGRLFPPVPFAVGLTLTLVFSAAGVLLPGVLYLRSASDHVAKNFAAGDE